ncbi:putative E3 ubiquitin-protein ligase HECTD2 [Armadillidium nasatum]|uniref:HECT-type E3 ubiquitin transferase n=1 Tax=Armadillidium nasatum TaxID=96803 RepID=A0A5N5STC0_9CRUS|nr:putative E3 ubiquitin-protein ligase HECTD2 [Armadillidium nasatum]
MFQRLANIRDLMSELEETLNSVSTTSISCSTCRGAVPLSGTRPFTTCPACGSLYNTSPIASGNRRNIRIELPHIECDSSRSRFGAFGQFIFNPFRSIGGINTRNNNNNNCSSLCSDDKRRNQSLPSSSCLGGRSPGRRDEEDTLNFFKEASEGKYRLGSGNSLPPIKNSQNNRSRRNSLRSGHERISRSEERSPSSQDNRDDTKAGNKPNYPTRNIQRHEIMKEVKKAKESKNYSEIKKFYFETFESYANICATFKRDPSYSGAKLEETGLNIELVQTVHDSLRELKHFLKGVINALLEERPRLFSKDRVRALFILIQSPIFLSQSSYNVLAHVIRTITELPNSDHQLLVSWFKTMEVSRFRLVIGFITQFITVRQFPPPDRSLPPLSSSKWWIPSATKVLAILYASNLASKPSLVSYTEFYNHTLDHMDLMAEYRRWQTPERPDSFSYCQYPFVLSIVAKRFILTKIGARKGDLKKKLRVTKLLSPPVVPTNEVFPVGIAKEPSLDDLSEIMPEIAHSLKELLKYEGDVEEDMCLTFQVSMEEYSGSHTFNLKENGETIPVSNQNRDEFVRLYLDWILNTAIYEQFRAFYLGFHTVTASNALIMLRPEEVEMLVCGSPTLDLNELRKVTEYDGYTADHPTIRWFWQVMNELPLEQQKHFLLFTTGSDRIPVGGMGEMPFKISCWRGRTNMLPQAHTCFNQLVLPPYPDKETLKSKLLIAINNAEGFGLE